MKYAYLFPASILIAASSLPAHLNASIDVVYGEDNRVDVYDSSDSVFVELASSTAAMIPQDRIKDNGLGEYAISGQSLESRGVCANERFAQQPSAADCSGFLVGENLLATAGHCVRDQLSCDAYKWVFDFKMEHEGQVEISVEAASVYSCKRVISRDLDTWTKNDYALIELDRKVEDRAPLKYRKSGQAQVGDELVVIGHPSGLPTKIADGAQIRSLEENFFSANLDTYGGNSGSPVINVSTGEVEGILVRGENDYVFDRDKRCNVTNYVLDDEGRGEDVTFIGNIPQLR